MKLIVYLLGALLGSGTVWAQTTQVVPASSPAGSPAASAVSAITLANLIEKGGWAMIPLAALSIISLTLVLVYLFTLRRGSIVTSHYMNTADVLLKKRDYAGLLAISARHRESVARVMQRTLDFVTKNPTADLTVIREIAQTEGATQAASLQHRIIYLADIGMLSPMVGLLGTVSGMISSFGVLASKSTQASRDVLLAAGVAEALVATAAGLVIGLLSFAFYSIFRGRVQSLISDLEIASAHLLALLASNLNTAPKKRERSSSPLSDIDEF